MDIFWSVALPLMKARGIKQKNIVDLTGRSSGRVCEWIKDGVIPRADDALKIADLLGVSVRYLLTGEDDKELSAREKELLKVCSLLGDDKFDIVLQTARVMRKDVQEASGDGSSSAVSSQ